MCNITGCGPQSNLPALTIDPKQRRLFLQGMATLPLGKSNAINPSSAARQPRSMNAHQMLPSLALSRSCTISRLSWRMSLGLFGLSVIW